ncbi:hypothetical protein Nepgr_018929 [Nepenthes gracilis]|uniref:Transmembrane protein n=1 Tax=Nepenthes gracilis TaxID=150966 RepID=A0AAD3SS92_NEPGR|nr:hypothetical protein Nepgr_018929 [Nepenthes gracilis]
MENQKPKRILGSSSSMRTTKQIMSSSKLVALGFLESLMGLAYLCAKQTSRASKKLHAACSKRLLGYKARNNGGDDDDSVPLWQRTILMGDKCQPLDFSGVIYYDSNGKRVHEMPKKSPYADRLGSNIISSSYYKDYY